MSALAEPVPHVDSPFIATSYVNDVTALVYHEHGQWVRDLIGEKELNISLFNETAARDPFSDIIRPYGMRRVAYHGLTLADFQARQPIRQAAVRFDEIAFASYEKKEHAGRLELLYFAVAVRPFKTLGVDTRRFIGLGTIVIDEATEGLCYPCIRFYAGKVGLDIVRAGSPMQPGDTIVISAIL